MTEKLEPCPVCGETPEGIVDATKSLGVFRITHRCKVWPAIMLDGYARERVIAAWNTRASGWQPIESAPKDGTPVDLWIVSDAEGTDVDSVDFYTNGLAKFNRKTRCREGRVTNMRWEQRGPNKGWYPVGGLPGMAMVIEPTHWMPIPPIPQGEG